MANWEERKDFRFLEDGNKCLSFIVLDTPLHKKQVDMLTEEFNDILGKGTELEQHIWHNLCEDLDQDGYGSFCLRWNHDVMQWLTDKQLEEINEIILDAFNRSDWGSSFNTMKSYLEDPEEMFETEDDLACYVDITEQCGYSVDFENDKEHLIPAKLHKEWDHMATLKRLAA